MLKTCRSNILCYSETLINALKLGKVRPGGFLWQVVSGKLTYSNQGLRGLKSLTKASWLAWLPGCRLGGWLSCVTPSKAKSPTIKAAAPIPVSSLLSQTLIRQQHEDLLWWESNLRHVLLARRLLFNSACFSAGSSLAMWVKHLINTVHMESKKCPELKKLCRNHPKTSLFC